MYCKTDSFEHCVKQSLQIASIFWCKKVDFDDEIVANRIEDKNAQIAAQQNEINALRLSASQANQNQYLIDQLKPCASPAYLVPNPNCCYNYNVTGCCNGCGNY